MPYTPEHKEQSRTKILKAASLLFASRGFDNVTIDEIMAAAGMTRGAFYAHFKTKAALYAESIASTAMNNSRARAFLEGGGSLEKLRHLVKTYLSRDHIDGPDEPCPLSFLVTDIVNREPQGRRAYTHVYQQLVAHVAEHVPCDRKKEREQRAYGISALLIGGVALGRAVGDDKTVDVLLASCLKTVEQLLTES